MIIKEGKTNLKYLLIVVILAAVVGGGILAYCQWILKQEFPPLKPSPKVNCRNINFEMGAGDEIGPPVSIEDQRMRCENRLEELIQTDWERYKDFDFTNRNCKFIKASSVKGEWPFWKWRCYFDCCELKEIDETADWKTSADWKTYKNEEYGFELNYPKDWNYVKSGQAISFYQGESWKGEGDIVLRVSLESVEGSYERWKEFWNKSNKCLSENCSVEQFYKTPNECKGPCNIEESYTLVAGKNSKVILIKNNPIGFSKEVFIEGRVDNWSIKVSSLLNYENIFNQILSTFRFLEPNRF